MKVIMYPAMTIDGFIADVNGKCYDWINDEGEASYNAAIKKAGCALVGRKTYEQYIDSYSGRGSTTTFVFTARTDFQDQEKVKFVHGNPAQVLKNIEALGFSEIILSGGGELNGAFAEAGLIDEIIVSIYSISLGDGIRLFGKHKPKLKLELLSSAQEVAGIVKNHYKVLK